MIFLAAASADFVDAVRHYRERSAPVARRFADEVRRNLDVLVERPHTCPVVRGEVRVKVLRRFPFSLLFMIEDERVVVVAVMHPRRRPDYWHHRVALSSAP